MVVVLCGDVHTESHSAGVDNVQAQGWSFVEREQAFDELEAAKKGEERATFELAMSRLSRARRSLRTRTTRSLGQVYTERIQGKTHGLSGCAHARNAVKELCIYGIVGHGRTDIYIYIENSARLHD